MGRSYFLNTKVYCPRREATWHHKSRGTCNTPHTHHRARRLERTVTTVTDRTGAEGSAGPLQARAPTAACSHPFAALRLRNICKSRKSRFRSLYARFEHSMRYAQGAAHTLVLGATKCPTVRRSCPDYSLAAAAQHWEPSLAGLPLILCTCIHRQCMRSVYVPYMYMCM